MNSFVYNSKKIIIPLLIIIINILKTSFNIKTKIKLSDGDFCIFKPVYEQVDKLIIKIDAKSEEPDKDIFTLIVNSRNNLVLQLTSVNSVDKVLDNIVNGEYEICFKPAYESELNLDYQINSEHEIGEYKDIAEKKQFEEVGKDLDKLSDLVNTTINDVQILTNKKYKHMLSKLNCLYY